MLDPFNKISDEEQKKLLQILESTTYTFAKNTSILPYISGQDMLGIVLEGTIQNIRSDHEGNRMMVEEIGERELFGTIVSGLNDNEHELIAKEKVKIIILDYFSISEFREKTLPCYTQFILNLLEMMQVITNKRNERIQILSQKTIRNRLLEYFRIFSAKNRSRIIYLPFTFTDLADYLAVDRSAMSREIKALKEENIIEVKNRKITLLYSSYPARK